VLTGAATAEGDEAEADYEKMSDPDLDGSSAGVVCQRGRQCESLPPAPFRCPPAVAAVATGAAAVGFSGGVVVVVVGNCSRSDETDVSQMVMIEMTTATAACHHHC
jgi:hypothetical protein